MYRSHRRRRHGVLLLVVLCVLFLFLLLALTYTVVASKERAMTRNYARYERSGDPPNVVLDSIAMTLFRDTSDLHSPFRSWSLLEGIYGNVSFRAQVASLQGATSAPLNQTPLAGGQFLTINSTAPNLNLPVTMTPPNYLKGAVLTMLTGQCAGLSTRVVASAPGSVTVMRFQADSGLYDPAAGDTFLINGRPYCGMGRGYNTSNSATTGVGTGLTFSDDAVDPDPALLASATPPGPLPSGVPGYYALFPNPVGFVPSTTYYKDSSGNPINDPSGPGGANMDYTAADYNNCYLGLMLNPLTPNTGAGIIPSFFRPDLYSYWQSQSPSLKNTPTANANAPLLRRIMFRPSWVDNPVFAANGSPSFNPANMVTPTNPNPPYPFIPGSLSAQFDVDNLGGGVPDSIWIDPGLPVMTARDGRTYKVLVAPCILDLDGRINVNAHGSVMNLDGSVSPATSLTGPNLPAGASATCLGTPQSATMNIIAGVAINQTVNLPVGQGYGPADINLNGLFSRNEVQAIIQGFGGWPGRYGGTPGQINQAFSVRDRALELLKFFEYPNNPLAQTPLTSFGTPPDLQSRRMLALDPRGQPVFLAPRQGNAAYWTNEIGPVSVAGTGTTIAGTTESPYAFKFDRGVARTGRYVSQSSPQNRIDEPFTVGELETVLREYDIDARSLPQRLYDLLPSVQPGTPQYNANQRNKLTTESWDLPTPSFQVPRNLRAALVSFNGQYRAFGIMDLLNAKLQGTPATATSNAATAEIAKLLPPELIAGLRMDINRPFGNGLDDNKNGIVDEPGSIGTTGTNSDPQPNGTPETLSAVPGAPQISGYGGSVPLNLVNASPGDPLNTNTLPPGVQARQLMARHLYALMMMLADPAFIQSGAWTSDTLPQIPTPQTLTTGQFYQQLFARRVAQWAINVVSFRDSTSIMTPFMYQWDIYLPAGSTAAPSGYTGYQGWYVDGDPGNTSQAGPNGPLSVSGTPLWGVVWACKPPDAVITETLAFHDKRIGDTTHDSGNNGVATGGVVGGTPPPDQGGTLGTANFDQVQIPQGSLYVEINCTRNPNNSTAPGDLYTLQNGQGSQWDATSNPWCLDLSRNVGSGANLSPVWRLVISQSRYLRSTGQYNSLTISNTPNYIGTHPDTTLFEPTIDKTLSTNVNNQNLAAQACQQMNLFGSSQNVIADRIAWLGEYNPAVDPSSTATASAWPQVYYNRCTTPVLVPPGSYAIIGPRVKTHIGAQGDIGSSTAVPKQWGVPAQQCITLSTSSLNSPTPAPGQINANAVLGPTNVSNMAKTLKSGHFAGTTMIVAADPPPLTAAAAANPQAWTNSAAYSSQQNVGIGLNISEPLPASGAYYPQPIVQNTYSTDGLYDAYDDLTEKTRVPSPANGNKGGFPDQPFEEIGSSYASFPLNNEAITATGTKPTYKIIFLQRLADPTSPYNELRNPYITVDWMPVDLTVFNGEELPTVKNPEDSNATPPVGEPVQISLASRQRGGSNPSSLPKPPYDFWSMITPLGDSLPPPPKTPVAGTNDNIQLTLVHTLGSLNQGYGPAMTQAQATQYVGDSAQPIPWIDWNARPYASPMELLNVPSSSPERLLYEFNSPGTPVAYPSSSSGSTTAITPAPTYNEYGTSTVGTSIGTFGNSRAPFGHLMNFFNSADSTYASGQASNLFQVLEYLQVPSRFVGTETFLNPSPSDFGIPAGGGVNPGTQYFQPPFNYVSNYRDPGKININTVTDPNVWACLMNGLVSTSGTQTQGTAPVPTFQQLCDSRRADGASTGAVINPPTSPTSPPPTYFGAPFRSAAAADLVPLQSMLVPGVDATLLRATGSTPNASSSAQSPVVPLFGGTFANSCNSAAQNSYFAYQGLERISNNVTTRSNVFGVWLTIGYFEAVPWTTVDAGHPDGYQLGEEIGSDTGEVERHRAFYIFDRSIPVGYERGQNHNVNRAILLKRYIE